MGRGNSLAGAVRGGLLGFWVGGAAAASAGRGGGGAVLAGRGAAAGWRRAGCPDRARRSAGHDGWAE